MKLNKSLELELDEGFLSVLVIIFVATFKSVNIAGWLIFFMTLFRLFVSCKEFLPSSTSLVISSKDKNLLKAPSSTETEIEMTSEIKTHKKKMTAKVISLERRPDRYEGFLKRFHDQDQLDFKLFKAIDGKQAETFFEQNKDERLIKSFKNFHLNVARGELGCLLSHYFVLKEIASSSAASDQDEIVFIFEDDVFISDDSEHVKDAFELISKFTTETPSDEWDLLYVSGRWSSSFCADDDALSSPVFELAASSGTSKIFSRNLSFAHNKGMNHNVDRCTTGMVVNTKSARKICDAIYDYFASVHPFVVSALTPIDHLLLKIDSLKTFDVFPHPFYSPHNYETDIQGRHNWEDVFSLNA